MFHVKQWPIAGRSVWSRYGDCFAYSTTGMCNPRRSSSPRSGRIEILPRGSWVSEFTWRATHSLRAHVLWSRYGDCVAYSTTGMQPLADRLARAAGVSRSSPRRQRLRSAMFHVKQWPIARWSVWSRYGDCVAYSTTGMCSPSPIE